MSLAQLQPQLVCLFCVSSFFILGSFLPYRHDNYQFWFLTSVCLFWAKPQHLNIDKPLNFPCRLINFSPPTPSSRLNCSSVIVDSMLRLSQAFSSSHSWLSRQPHLVQSSKLLVASLSCPELGTAQPQLVLIIVKLFKVLHVNV